MRRYTVSVTTAADGTATAYSPSRISGKIHQIGYVKGDFANGVDFTITAEATGANIWTEADVNASKVCAPRLATHTTAGVAATLDGTVPALEPVAIGHDRVKIVIAQGGNAKSGTFHILVD
ncbi:hypothetical protein [Tsuneonella sp. HG222]